MDDLIRRKDTISAIKAHHDGMAIYCKTNTPRWDGYSTAHKDIAEVISDAIPAVDAVERGVFEQVAWERDIALAQLSVIGKGLGEKMDDAAKVVLCRDCLYWGNRWTGCPKLHGLETPDDFFCKYGKPKEDR